MMFRLRYSRVVVPAAFGMMLAGPASAQEIRLFSWMGRVDRDVRLTVQPGSVSNSTERSIQSRSRARVSGRLPRQDGELRVSMDRGRGQATVVQQPSASNGFTGVIDIADPDGGADLYSLTAYFVPTSNRTYGNRGRWERTQSGGDYIGNAPAMHWSGDVDGGVELTWTNRSISSRSLGGAPRNVNSSTSGARVGDPNRSVTVNVRDGRGRVEVVQQPSASNNYTTIIRIVDPQSGIGHYSIDAVWR
jgi:hypothetical protein